MTEEDERFAAIYHRNYSCVVRYASRRIDPDVAGDVAARTFADAYRRLAQAPGDESAERVWLLGIARGHVSNERRGRRRRRALDERVMAWRAPAGVPPVDGEVITRLAFHQALGRLPGNDREALRLFYWEGLSVEEAAAWPGAGRARWPRA